jgi:subtilisin-like proprotein convertase family protein
LHERAGDEFHDIIKSYTVGLSGEAADGAWSLEVRDVSTGNNGGIDSWTLTLK